MSLLQERKMYWPLERCTCLWKKIFLPLESKMDLERKMYLLETRDVHSFGNKYVEIVVCLWTDRCSCFRKERCTCLSEDVLASGKKDLHASTKIYHLWLEICNCLWKEKCTCNPKDVLASGKKDILAT